MGKGGRDIGQDGRAEGKGDGTASGCDEGVAVGIVRGGRKNVAECGMPRSRGYGGIRQQGGCLLVVDWGQSVCRGCEQHPSCTLPLRDQWVALRLPRWVHGRRAAEVRTVGTG